MNEKEKNDGSMQGDLATMTADDSVGRPSDFAFHCGLTQPIDVDPSAFPVDMTSFADILATELHTSSCWVANSTVQLAASLVTWIKILLLASILIDSILPRCTDHAECKSGLFCFPLALNGFDGGDWPTETRGNSICNDCLLASLYNDTSSNVLVPADGVDILRRGRDYCSNDDPERCDFLRINRGKYSFLSLIVLCCLCGMFGRMIYTDLHKLHVQQRLFSYRVELLATERKKSPSASNTVRLFCVKVVNWFAYTSRAYILPSWMCSSAALLLASWAPTTRNLILVPIQIGLISNFDMVLEFLFFRQSQKDFTKDAANSLQLQCDVKKERSSSSSAKLDKALAILIRLYSIGLSVQIPVFVLLAESIYPAVSFFVKTVGNNNKYSTPIPIPCNDVMAAGIFFPLLLSVPLCLMLGPTVHSFGSTAYHLTTYASTFLFVLYSWIPVFEVMTKLQLQSI